MDNNTKETDTVDPEKASLVDLQQNAKIVPTEGAESSQKTISPLNNGSSNPDGKQGRGSAAKQILAALAAQLGTVSTGMVFGFSAIALPQMKKADSFIHVDSAQESWIASINAIGTPIGCLFSGYLADILGRKMTLILTEIPAILGWLLIAFATDINMIYAGRFFVGLGSGMVGAPARVYAAEVTQPHLRGMLVAIASVGVSSGVLIEYLLGALLPWNIVAGISTIIPLSSLILIFLFPETPSYLMSRNKPEKARRALTRLRGSTCNLDKEMDILVNFSEKNQTKRLTGAREILRAVLKPNAIKPFIVLAIYFLVYQWSGTNALTFYAVEIFNDAGTNISGYLLTVILGLVRLVSTIAACILCRRCGRRPLTFLSSVGCALSMLILGSYKFAVSGTLASGEKLSSSHSWIPVFCVFSYTVFCTLGFLVIPWVMIGEIYPVQVRGIVGGMTTMCAHTFVFTVVKSYPFLKSVLTESGIYIMYGLIPLLGTIYLYFYLPETKGKTLQEIEDYYSGKSTSLSSRKQSASTTSAAAKPQVLEAKKGQLLP